MELLRGTIKVESRPIDPGGNPSQRRISISKDFFPIMYNWNYDPVLSEPFKKDYRIEPGYMTCTACYVVYEPIWSLGLVISETSVPLSPIGIPSGLGNVNSVLNGKIRVNAEVSSTDPHE